MSDEPPALRASGVRVSLKGTEILRGVDLDVGRGCVLGILGPSGAGKSTLFRVIAGELSPAAGRILLSSEDVTGAPLWERARRGLGYVPQEPSVLWDLTVADNIRTFETASGARGRPVERAREVELDDRMNVKARALSGGERRRLEILRALSTDPKVLLCDEPFSAIDPARAERLGALLRKRADSGTAVVIADHRVREALGICDDVILLVDGRVQVRLPPHEFTRHPAVRERYLG